MTSTSTRRSFLKNSAALALAGSAIGQVPSIFGVEPFKRGGAPRLAMSLAAYSFRDFFAPEDSAKKITLFDFVDFCAEQGCQGAELTSYYFPAAVTAEFLLKLKRHAFLRGIEISGSAVGNTFTLPPGEKRDEQIKLVKDWVDHAALLGAPHIRVFAGGKPKETDLARATNLCIQGLEECAAYAGSKGIFLGLENHGGIVAEASALLEIVRAVKSPWLGINLDTGNFHTDDPYADLTRCAPYAVNVQIKVEIKRRNQSRPEPSDIERIIRILRDANYQGYVALEYEADDPWKAVPVWLKKIHDALQKSS